MCQIIIMRFMIDWRVWQKPYGQLTTLTCEDQSEIRATCVGSVVKKIKLEKKNDGSELYINPLLVTAFFHNVITSILMLETNSFWHSPLKYEF